MAGENEKAGGIKGQPRVFVYGSLKAGHSNHRLLANYTYLGPAYIEGPYRMMSLGFFPGVTSGHEGQNNRVYGEVYAVDEEGLASLDLLEGHPNFYRRERVKTNVPEYGGTWCYFLCQRHDQARDIFPAIWQPDEAELFFWGEELSANAA